MVSGWSVGTEQLSETAWLHMWPSELAAAGIWGIEHPAEETGSTVSYISYRTCQVRLSPSGKGRQGGHP